MHYTNLIVYIKNICKVYKYNVVSLNVCQETGTREDNSTVRPSNSTVISSTRAFQMIPPKYITLNTLTSLPDDLTVFHTTIESG